jgi:hypothetical protein
MRDIMSCEFGGRRVRHFGQGVRRNREVQKVTGIARYEGVVRASVRALLFIASRYARLRS